MGRRAGLVALVGVASAVAWAAPAGAISVGGPTHQRTEHATVSGLVRGLSVRGEVGDITVTPGSVTRIVATEHYNFDAPTLVHSLRDGVLSVSAPCPRPTGAIELGLNNCWVDLAITVPRAITVNAFDDVGDVRVNGLHGAETLRSSDGSIVAQGIVASTLVATSDTGAVQLRRVRAGDVTLRSSDGDIQADLAAVPRRVAARDDTGDIDLTVPTGTYALDLHSDDGSTHVSGITRQSDAGHRLSARTSDGDIRIVGR